MEDLQWRDLSVLSIVGREEKPNAEPGSERNPLAPSDNGHNRLFKCLECGKRFPSHARLARHLYVCHRALIEGIAETKGQVALGTRTIPISQTTSQVRVSSEWADDTAGVRRSSVDHIYRFLVVRLKNVLSGWCLLVWGKMSRRICSLAMILSYLSLWISPSFVWGSMNV